MRKCFAALVAVAVCTLQAQAMAFHVHASLEHIDEPAHDHHHGPAIHHHENLDGERHIDGDDGADRVITLTVPTAAGSAQISFDVEVSAPLPAAELQISGEVRPIDFRSHGPPPSHDCLLRGPPSLSSL